MPSRRRLALVAVCTTLVLAMVDYRAPLHAAEKIIPRGPRRFDFKFDPSTPLRDLLPTPPAVSKPGFLNDDLTAVPEVDFGDRVAMDTKDTEHAMANVMAKISHLNRDDPDGFLKALLASRADLRGLPFLMGKDCRMDAKQAQLFAETVAVIQDHLHNVAMSDPEVASVPNLRYTQELYWRNLDQVLADKGSKWVRDKKTEKGDDIPSCRYQASRQELESSGMRCLIQMIPPRTTPYHVVMAKYLATVQTAESTHALARLALFSPHDDVRLAAIDALKTRHAKDHAPVLLQGFRYPLPVVAARAADAVATLQCKDVLGDLVNILEQPDPRAPAKQTIDGKEVTAVRELVRVNHHRNCLLCHAPANSGNLPPGVLTAPVPLPDQSLRFRGGGYGGSLSPDIFVRIDVTYLRQDFSLLMKVENAKPWPEMQRYDFFVRTRVISNEEARECDKQLEKQGTPPSHAATQRALRGLTGQSRDLAAAEWRRFLNLPARP
jgi:hypothetical protein